MSHSKKHPVRSLVINGLLIALAFGLLGLAIWQNREQIEQVFARRIDFRLFAMAQVFYLAGITLTFVRWYLLVKVIDDRFRLRDALLLSFIGNAFNLVIPGAVGGDFIKAAYLVRMNINRTQAVASMVIDRIIGLLGLFLLAGVAGFFAWPLATQPVRILIVLVWCAVFAGFATLFAIFNQSLTRAFPSLLEGSSRRAGILRELRIMSTTYRSRLPLIGAMLLVSSTIHFGFVTCFYIVSRAMFGAALPSFGSHLVIVPLLLFSTAVPLPFGALGLSEQIGSQLFSLVRHPGGALAMMGFRVLMYGGGLVSVAVYLSRLSQVRELTDAAEEIEEEMIEGSLDDPHPGPSVTVE
ncbi:MAG: lysylphosphatidylglycerol synthase transmembrane domain-containing protein [Isosphaeraceae bacterium]